MSKIKSANSGTKKEIITTAAARLFKEKGYKAASMRELASIVGVEAASLYNHIKSKDELLRIICYEVNNTYQVNIEQIDKENCTIIKKVEKILRFHVKMMIEKYEKVYVTDHDWRKMEEPQLSEFRELRRGYRKKFTSIVQQGIDAREIKPVDANSAVMIFINAMGAIDQWHRIIHKVDSQSIEDITISILIDGIKK